MFYGKGYPVKKIGDVIEKTISRVAKVFEKTDEIQYLDISSIDNSSKTVTGLTPYVLKDAPSRAQYVLKQGDIMYSTVRPNLQNIAINPYSDDNVVGSTGFCVLRCTGVTTGYMWGVINSVPFTEAMTNQASGANYPAVTDKVVHAYEIPVPPVEEQTAYEQLVKQSDKSKFTGFKSQFIELFGKLPEEFKHATVALGDIADMLSGGTPSSKHPEYYGGPYPFVTTPCLGKNYIDSSDAVNWLSEIGVEKSSTHIIPAYSIMYGSRVGVGKSSINTCDMCTNQDILSFFNIDTSKYDLLFIKKVMDQYFDYVDAQKRGSTIKGVPSDVVKSIRIPVVAIEEQKSFAAFTEQSDKSK